jgi:hypothetical protein
MKVLPGFLLNISLSLGIAALVCAPSLHAQGGWVNSPLMDSSGYIREDAYPGMPSVPAADQIYSKLDGEHLKKDFMMPIVDISYKSRDAGDK